MTRQMDNQNYRVGRCGWPMACFDDQGNQLYTPETLDAAYRAADSGGPCPPGVCMPGRGSTLTGSHAEYDARVQRNIEIERRAYGFAQAEIANRAEWAPVGDVEVGTPVPVQVRVRTK